MALFPRMGLSTSVSSRAELRVWLLVAGVLLMSEVAVRVAVSNFSEDTLRIRGIPELMRTMREAHGPTVLFLGNSIAETGINAALVERALQRDEADAAVVNLTPRNSTVLDYIYLHEKYVAASATRPDIIVLPFVRNQLSDGDAALPERLTRWVAWGDDWRGVLFDDLTGFEQRTRFVLAEISVAFSKRWLVRQRVLDMPFRRMAGTPNAVAIEYHLNPRPGSYRQLRRFINGAQSNGSRLVIIAMPTHPAYGIDQELIETIRSAGVQLIDARQAPVDGSHFSDTVHLKPAGRDIVTRYLMSQFADSFR